MHFLLPVGTIWVTGLRLRTSGRKKPCRTIASGLPLLAEELPACQPPMHWFVGGSTLLSLNKLTRYARSAQASQSFPTVVDSWNGWD